MPSILQIEAPVRAGILLPGIGYSLYLGIRAGKRFAGSPMNNVEAACHGRQMGVSDL